MTESRKPSSSMISQNFRLWTIILGGFFFSACSHSETVAETHTTSTALPSPVSNEKDWSQVQVAVSPASVENGTFVSLSVNLGKNSTIDGHRLRVLFRGKSFELYASDSQAGVWILPVAIDYDQKPGPVSIKVGLSDLPAGSEKSAAFKVVAGKYKKEQLKVAPKFTSKPDPELEARIAREQKMTAAVYAAPVTNKKWKGHFKLPITSEFTSFFGTQRIFNGKRQSVHQGLDLRAKIGTPVHAAADGVVVLAADLFFSGNTVLVDHGMGVITQYFHFSQLGVQVGQVVRAGDLLGKSGATGRVSGPHLHWGVMMQGLKINPLPLTQRMPE